MKASTLMGLAVGMVTGAMLISTSPQLEEAMEKGKKDLMHRFKKLKSVMG